METKTLTMCMLLALVLAVAGCQSEPAIETDPTDPVDPTDPTDPVDPTDPTDPVDPTDPTDPVDPTDPTDPVDPIPQRQAISDCGGFEAYDDPTINGGGDDYCDAERLQWRYDASAELLELTNTRVGLNCCGEHSIEVELIDGVYVVTETDAPVDGARCNCNCVFDFSVEAEGIPAEVISLRLVRHVTDHGAAPVTVWEGDLDVGAGAGSVVVDESGAGELTLEQISDVSECGGFEREPTTWGPEDLYCAAEQLSWSYDEATSTLELINSRVILNCCGDHDMRIDIVDGVYVVTETDAVNDPGDRCWCTCVFDFSVTASGVPAEVIPVRLVRHITDDGAGPVVLWEGDLDLSAGAGSVVIDETEAGEWCE